MNKVFAVGVGPGSPKYVTDVVKEAISQCDVVIGYGYTIKTIEEYVKGKKILEVTTVSYTHLTLPTIYSV